MKQKLLYVRPSAEVVEVTLQNIVAESSNTDFNINNPFEGFSENLI